MHALFILLVVALLFVLAKRFLKLAPPDKAHDAAPLQKKHGDQALRTLCAAGGCSGCGTNCNRPLKPQNDQRVSELDYFDDEQLDAYKHTAEDAYTDAQIAEFEAILTTMQAHEVSAWLRALHKRGIALPLALKHHALTRIQDAL